jgi:hypothetical protein
MPLLKNGHASGLKNTLGTSGTVEAPSPLKIKGLSAKILTTWNNFAIILKVC